jgi:hypothetical protein
MKLRATRSTLLVTLVALLAGTTGAVVASVGTAAAGTASISSVTSVASELGDLAKPKKGKGKKSKSLNAKKVKKLAAKEANKAIGAWAPGGTVGNANGLGGQPPSAYLTGAYTVTLGGFSAPNSGSSSIRTKNWTLPPIPGGTYLATLSLSAEVSNSGASLYCALYQDGQEADLLTAYGAASTGVYRTVGASQVVTVTSTVRVQCQALTNSGYRILNVPADNAYSPAQVSFVKVDSAAGLGNAP